MAGDVRLGVIVPSVNTVVENWYPKIVPDRDSVHFARMLIADGSSPEEIIAVDREHSVRAIHQIASCRPHAIASVVQRRALSKATRLTNACAPTSGISPRRRRRLRPTASSRPVARSA
jgi:maleate cis-trans isomerase